MVKCMFRLTDEARDHPPRRTSRNSGIAIQDQNPDGDVREGLNVYVAMLAFCVAVTGLTSTLPVFWNLPTAYFAAATAAAGIGAITSGYLAPQFMGILHDASGGYRVPLLVSGCLAFTAPLLIAMSGIGLHVRGLDTQVPTAQRAI